MDPNNPDTLQRQTPLRVQARRLITSLEVSRVDAGGAVSHRVQELLARPVSDPVAALAAALECAPHEVTGLFRARGDHDWADMLDGI